MVVDDHAVVRAGFVAILDAEPDLEVVGEAGDGAAAVATARDVRPDVVLMDIRMPGVDGLTATRLVTATGARVVVLTTFDLDEYVFEALRAGASGFLLKDAEPQALVDAVRLVAAGEAMLSPSVTRRLIGAFVAGGGVPRQPPDALTAREVEVLVLVARGLSNADIGAKLGITGGTVKAHVNGLLPKLGVDNRIQATIRAYDLGLVQPRPHR